MFINPPVTRVIIPTPNGNLSVMGEIIDSYHKYGSLIIKGKLVAINIRRMIDKDCTAFLKPCVL